MSKIGRNVINVPEIKPWIVFCVFLFCSHQSFVSKWKSLARDPNVKTFDLRPRSRHALWKLLRSFQVAIYRFVKMPVLRPVKLWYYSQSTDCLMVVSLDGMVPIQVHFRNVVNPSTPPLYAINVELLHLCVKHYVLSLIYMHVSGPYSLLANAGYVQSPT